MAGLDAVSINLWPSFVEKVQDVVRAGLERLAVDAGKNGFGACCENDLNRELFFRMRRIAANRHKLLLSLSPCPALCREHTWNLVPVNEANNQPSPDDPERTPRENKRPDFQWSFQDDQAVDLDRATRTYVVECKRLGQAIGTWIFNMNYVAQGVRRYIDKSHLYGKDDIGGCMIGYIQSMDVETIWTEVDQQLNMAGYERLPKPSPFPGSSVLHFASHDLTRLDSSSPFQLNHVWVDLR
ncbi:hypothetical protein SAMN05216315_12933 [Nitrosospira sp. Nsp18]|uniref:hypothetical protein n=1 Tax=Nitrosospira sp. Nsp18 TaxID=1855334 RepID=UPI000885A544|nr:hypothetical protein [Nitrosospira sp. Nsp18]SDA26260.1 hypothetical protein SAMN05216315_12933 [Nitrosospira sp. Nsp18]